MIWGNYLRLSDKHLLWGGDTKIIATNTGKLILSVNFSQKRLSVISSQKISSVVRMFVSVARKPPAGARISKGPLKFELIK